MQNLSVSNERFERVDKTCRNHGSCEHCAAGRMHKVLRQMPVEDVEAVQDLMVFKERYKNGK
jgi:hypothetical protein